MGTQPLLLASSRTADRKGERLEILLAEDNAVNRMVATRLLESRGHRVFAVANGQEAVDAIMSGKFDIVFMDCQMPVMDGFRAAILIREFESQRSIRRTPIVALTANALKGDRDRCIEVGMDDYLSKPVRPESLNAVLRQWASWDAAA